jgi:hypothetical protein
MSDETTNIASQPVQAAEKSFDVALVDPGNPAIVHFPRRRVTIAAATVEDLTPAQKAPPPGGESAQAETKRLAYLVADLERQRAIAAYNADMRIDGSMLRYDVVPASGNAPELPAAWIEHLKFVSGQ